MSEASYSLVVNITVKIEILLFAVCMAAFFYPFMIERKEQEKSRIKKGFMVFVIYAVMYFVNMTTSIYGWLCMIIVLMLLAAGSKFLDMDRKYVFFLGVIFFCIKNLSVLIMRSISYFLGKNLEHRAETAEDVFGNAAWNYVFVAVLQMILFSVMLYAVASLLKKKTMRLHIKELCCLLLIPITGILFVNIIFNILIIVNENIVFQLYEQFPVFPWIVPMVAALFYAGILITIVSYQKMIGLQEENISWNSSRSTQYRNEWRKWSSFIMAYAR